MCLDLDVLRRALCLNRAGYGHLGASILIFCSVLYAPIGHRMGTLEIEIESLVSSLTATAFTELCTTDRTVAQPESVQVLFYE